MSLEISRCKASSDGSRCSSRDGARGWCRPLWEVGARCSYRPVRVQCVAHSESWGRFGSFVFTFASAKTPKRPGKIPRTPTKMKCCVTNGSGYYPQRQYIICFYKLLWTTFLVQWGASWRLYLKFHIDSVHAFNGFIYLVTASDGHGYIASPTLIYPCYTVVVKK
jgi:hypothetical protein